MKTPHPDQMVAEGTVFDACITPSVVCQPARALILTGRLCRTHGVHDNGIDLRARAGSKGVRGRDGRILPQTDDQLRKIIANTYGQIAFIDHQARRIINALMDEGVDDNTIVIYISDHGDWVGDHDLILKGPMPYDGLFKAPMIVKKPDAPAGKVVEDPAATLAFGTTFIDDDAAVLLPVQHGQSPRPLNKGAAARDFWPQRMGRFAGSCRGRL